LPAAARMKLRHVPDEPPASADRRISAGSPRRWPRSRRQRRPSMSVVAKKPPIDEVAGAPAARTEGQAASLYIVAAHVPRRETLGVGALARSVWNAAGMHTWAAPDAGVPPASRAT